MSTYLVLIYGDEQAWDAETPQQRRAKGEQHAAFAAKAGDALLGGHELRPTTEATTLRGGPDGRPLVTDGPFLETREVIGGYYLLEAADREEAVALAALLPELAEARGAIEIRPVHRAG